VEVRSDPSPSQISEWNLGSPRLDSDDETHPGPTLSVATETASEAELADLDDAALQILGLATASDSAAPGVLHPAVAKQWESWIRE